LHERSHVWKLDKAKTPRDDRLRGERKGRIASRIIVREKKIGERKTFAFPNSRNDAVERERSPKALTEIMNWIKAKKHEGRNGIAACMPC